MQDNKGMIDMTKQLSTLSKVKGNTFTLHKGKKKFKKEKIIDFLIFVGPALFLFTLFFTVPLVQGIYYSFTNWNAVGVPNFVGLRNYTKLIFEDTQFHQSLKITFYIAAFNVVFTNILAMLFAIGLTTKFKLNNLLRGIIFLPNMISLAIAGFIWRFMFTKVSSTIYQTTHIPVFGISWIGDSSYVLLAIVIVSLWQGLGYILTIYIAGILSIDDSIIEAASIDGANGWQSFFKIKLPLMLPIVAVGAFLNLSGSLKIFDVVFSLTSGGPGNSSEVAMLNIYREAFIYNKFGYGSAKAVILSLIIIIITFTQLKITSSKEVKL